MPNDPIGKYFDFNVVEGTTYVGDAGADVPQNKLYNPHTNPFGVQWSIVSDPSTDAAKFTIDPKTGEISFVSAPDFSNPTDWGTDGNYHFVVNQPNPNYNPAVWGSQQYIQKEFLVHVYQEPVEGSQPETLYQKFDILENQAEVGTLGTGSYTITGGDDKDLFQVDAQGHLSFKAAPDYEHPQDVGGDNHYDLEVTTAEGNLLEIRVNVGDVGTVYNQTASIPEHTVDTGLSADGTAALTGADASLFHVENGHLTFNTAPDYEDNSHAHAYDVSQAVGEDTYNYHVDVTNIDDNPLVWDAPDHTKIGQIDEDNSVLKTNHIGESVGFVTLNATDADGSQIQYALVDDAQGRFALDQETGEITVKGRPLDYEDNGHITDHLDITVRATSADGDYIDHTYSIGLNDVFEQDMNQTILDHPGQSSVLDASDPNNRVNHYAGYGGTNQLSDNPNLNELGSGNDTINGWDGNDTIYGRAGDDILLGGDGQDHLEGGTGNDWLYGEMGNDTIFGGNGNDVAWGGAGNDYMNGGDGNDWLEGWDGADGMLGGNGNDNLVGRTGDDYLEGGAGKDVFWVAGGFGHDVIGDFKPGEDKINLSGWGITDQNFDQLVKMTQYGGDTQIVLYGQTQNTLYLQHVTPDQLHHSDFLLA